MKKILAFAGSNSKSSINKQLATYTASKVTNTTFEVADLNDYSLPIFSLEIEAEGFPNAALRFNELLSNYDGFVVSLAEHNGSYSAAFKNLFDWLSRVDRKIFKEKPVLLMATSPGARGGKTVLESATTTFPHMGADIVATFSLPNFYEHFINEELKIEEMEANLSEAVQKFQSAI